MIKKDRHNKLTFMPMLKTLLTREDFPTPVCRSYTVNTVFLPVKLESVPTFPTTRIRNLQRTAYYLTKIKGPMIEWHTPWADGKSSFNCRRKRVWGICVHDCRTKRRSSSHGVPASRI